MEFYGNMTELKTISAISGKIDSFLLGLKKSKCIFAVDSVDRTKTRQSRRNVSISSDNLIFNMTVNEVNLNQNEECNRNLLLKQTCSHYIISGCVTLTSTVDMFPRTT